MAELAIPPLASPVDPEKRREELAFLEGHDADIPTEDQTAGLPTSSGFGSPVVDHPEESPVNNSELVLESPVNGHNEKTSQQLNESTSELYRSQDSEKRSERVHDPEAGHRSSSTNRTEAEIPVDELQDPNIVWWDGPDDPENPLNWSESLKMGNVAIISLVTFITHVSHVCLFAPGS